MRYQVWFIDCDNCIEFDTLEDATHCAVLNAGNVLDTETGEVIVKYGWE